MVLSISKRRRLARDAGFTLVEAMIAGTIGLALALPALAILRTTSSTAFVVNSRIQRNIQARQVLTALGEGSSGSYGASFVRGFREAGSVTDIQTSGGAGQFAMTDPGTKASISGDLTPGITVNCTAPQMPIPPCPGVGWAVIVYGWLGAAPVITAPTSGRTVAVGITISDPYQATRPVRTKNNVTDTYRSQFNLNVQ